MTELYISVSNGFIPIHKLRIYQWAHLAIWTMYNVIYYGASIFATYIEESRLLLMRSNGKCCLQDGKKKPHMTPLLLL